MEKKQEKIAITKGGIYAKTDVSVQTMNMTILVLVGLFIAVLLFLIFS